jgi:hypothetical protein
VLRLLADQKPPLACLGPTLDRGGRTGLAVAVTGGGTRYTLIFDPLTGGLLADEELLLRNPPALSGPTPRAISSWLFLTADRTDHLPG